MKKINTLARPESGTFGHLHGKQYQPVFKSNEQKTTQAISARADAHSVLSSGPTGLVLFPSCGHT